MSVKTTPNVLNLYWLSFADPRKPRGSQHLGCVIAEAENEMDAITKCHQRNCNPGGEVRVYSLKGAEHVYVDAPRFRLLTKEELEFYGEKAN